MSKPSLVLVHGSWHSPEHYGPLIKVLSSHGYKCVPVALPSVHSDDPVSATLGDDTAAVRSAVTRELDAGNRVVVVSHSYGGGPANNALKGLDEANRKVEGKNTAVAAIVFVAAMPLPLGMSFTKLLASADTTSVQEQYAPGLSFPKSDPGPAHFFFNDISPEEAQKWVDILKPQSLRIYTEETSYAAYNDIQSYYMCCTLDNALPYKAQLAIVKAATDAGAKIQTEEFECSHSPFLSIPQETSTFIRKVCGENVA